LRLALRQSQAAAKTEQAIQTIAFATRDNNLPVGEAYFSWNKRGLKISHGAAQNQTAA
jgi:hypothetical protein